MLELPKLSARVRVEREGRTRLDVDVSTSDLITAVMGPSGAGKTTLLLAIAGLVRPTGGRIALGSRVLFDAAVGLDVPVHERRVAMVFQSLALFPHLSVLDNVLYGIRGGARRERIERARRWLRQARAEGLERRSVTSLSGGEAQRVAIARALASEPALLLLDEPFSALDESLRRAVGDVILELVEMSRTPTLVVTHDRRDAERLASRLLVIEAGRIVADRALS